MRPTATLVAATLLASSLAACSDDEPAGPPRPEDAEQGEQVDVDAFFDELRASFDEGRTATVRFDVTGQARLRGRGVVRYGDSGMDVDLQLSDWEIKGGTVDLRTVGEATYMKVPESRGLWVDITAGDVGVADSVLQDADPRAEIDDARDEITEVRYTGDETVGGVQVRRYQVVAKTDATPGATTDGPVVTEYWFDADGRVVRRQVDLGASGSAIFSWAHWGEPVDIGPPPDDETITVRELERLRKQQEHRDH